MRDARWVRTVLAMLVVVATASATATAAATEPTDAAPADPPAGPGADVAIDLAGESGAPTGEATGGPSGAVTCNAWVRDGGVDAADRGAKATPFATLGYALSRAAAGLHTLCIPAGALLTLQGGGEEIARGSTVLAGDPAATLATRPRLRGQLTVTGNNVTVRGVEVTHTTRFASTIRLWGDDVSLFDSAVRATQGTCVEVGYLDANVVPVDNAGSARVPHKVHDVVIRDNDIGPCANAGTHPGDPFLSSWECNYSGLPGIYSQWVEGLDITGNYIHDTALRGVQLYPKNDLVRVENNLFRRNSIAVNIGTAGEEDDDPNDDDDLARSLHQATRISVQGNVLAEQNSSQLAALYPNMRGPAVSPAGGTCASNKFLASNPPSYTVDDEATLYAQMQPPQVPVGVTVTGNCGTDARRHPDDPANGFVWSANTLATPLFVSAQDPHQTPNPCGALGPVALRSENVDPPPVLHSVELPEGVITDRNITLRTSASADAFEMRIANDDEAFGPWRAYLPDEPWTLSGAASQTKQVRVQVRDTAGQVSEIRTDTVTLRPTHDLSGDTYSDLLVRRTSDQQLRLYRGTSSGGLATPTASMTGSWAIFNRVIVTADWNGDDRTDVIARVGPGQTGSGQLRLYPGNNAGGLGTGTTIGTGWGTFPSIVAPGDFNGDGNADLLAVKGNGTLWLYPGNGTGSFRASSQIGTSTAFGAYTLYTPGDFDRDGAVDLIVRRSDGVLLLGRGNGRGGFRGAFTQIGTGWSTLTVVGAGDMNRDMFPDLVARKANGTLWVYRGNGTGGFNGSYQIGTSTAWGIFDVLA